MKVGKTMGKVNLVLLFAAVSIASAYDAIQHMEEAAYGFERFVETYGKKYENEMEKAMRFGIYLGNLDEIEYLNKINEHTSFGVTQFADLTNEEFVHYHTGYDSSLDNVYSDHCSLSTHISDVEAPIVFDWRNEGVVTSVKTQGNCASSWALSAIANVESINAIKTHNIQELSAQQLVDCVSVEGCKFGIRSRALSYLKNKGSMSEGEYPYKAHVGRCNYNDSKVAVNVQDCLVVTADENNLDQKLFALGPLTMVIASGRLQHYIKGIVSGDACQSNYYSYQAVLLVGYGVEFHTRIKYWVVKNSWGKGWGEEGYVKIRRGVNCIGLMDSEILTAA